MQGAVCFATTRLRLFQGRFVCAFLAAAAALLLSLDLLDVDAVARQGRLLGDSDHGSARGLVERRLDVDRVLGTETALGETPVSR